MNATDELCRLLDEQGVEYEKTPWSCGAAVWWRDSSGTMWRAHDNEEDELLSFYAYNSVTPEQAIAATLGLDDAYTREEVEGAFVSGYSLGSLPVGSDPRWDENRQTVDEHMAELGWVRVSDTEGVFTDTDGHDLGHVRNVSSTLGRGTCKPMIYDNGYSVDRLEPGEYHEFWEPACACGNCGELIPMRKFCPNCGHRLEVDDG